MKHTFVICAYKESPYLEECIQSLKNQTISSIILLATSTPSEYLERMCKKYQIEYHVRDGVPGIAPDWNYALSVAATPYVTIAHQDDVYEPEYASKIMETAETYEKETKHCPLVLFTDYSELVGDKKDPDRRNLKVKKMLLKPLRKRKNQSRKIWKRHALHLGNAVSCPTITYHMEYIQKLLEKEGKKQLFLEHFRSNLDWEALEWLSRKEGSFVYVPEVLVAHRIHEGSETTAAIHDNQRSQEDYEMLSRFWFRWIAKLILKVYSESEKSNEV